MTSTMRLVTATTGRLSASKVAPVARVIESGDHPFGSQGPGQLASNQIGFVLAGNPKYPIRTSCVGAIEHVNFCAVSGQDEELRSVSQALSFGWVGFDNGDGVTSVAEISS